MATPCFRKYWHIKYRDGSTESQFDSDGNYHLWNPVGAIDAISFIPIDEEFAKKIISKGTLAKPINDSIVKIHVNGDGIAEYHRNCKVQYTPHAVCGFCNAELQEGKTAICPRCYACNWWYCDICDELKLNVIKNGNKILCPDCYEVKIERGLQYVRAIFEYFEETHRQIHIVDVDGNRHIILDSRLQN